MTAPATRQDRPGRTGAGDDAGQDDLPPYEERTVLHALSSSARRRPDEPAVIDRDRRLTYRELTGTVAATAGALQAWLHRSGWEGTPVALRMGNHVDHVVLWLSLATLGVPQVEINPDYAGDRLHHILRDSGARTVVTDSSGLGVLDEAARAGSGPDRVLVRPDGDGPGPARATDLPPVTVIGDLPDAAPVDTGRDDVAPSDLMGIYYTSGTTGTSKGVRTSHGHAYHYCRPAPLGAATGEDVSLISLPLHHVGGLLWGVMNAIVAGATAVVPGDFSVSRFWDVVDEHQVTFTTLVGAMVEYLLRETDARDNPLRAVCMAPVPPSVDEFRARFDVQVCSGYGSTEAGSPLACPVGTAPRPNELGWPRTDYEVAVVDEHDLPVDPGVTGELVVRPAVPDAMTSGYHGRPGFTLEQCRNLWFHTDDLVRETDRGSLKLVGRKVDVIRHRGENVSAAEVEDVLLRSGRVEACAVVGVPSEYTEEDILAVVVWRDDDARDLEGLVELCEEHLPAFAVPDHFRSADDLPRTSTGKVQRFVLKEQGLTGEETTPDRGGRHR